MNRYARQVTLPEVGAKGQARLRRAHVLVAGAGGLGVPVLQYLAGAGVGTITLIDGDEVTESNLHRQPLYRMQDIGRPKAQAAAAALAVLRLAADALTAATVPNLALDLTLPNLVAALHAAGLPSGTASLQTLQALLDGKDIASLRAQGAEAYEPLITAAGPAAAALTRLQALAKTLPPAAAQALTARLGPLAEIIAALTKIPNLTLTLDPTERHGFEYQSWLGFSVFGANLPTEIGRGGSYTLLHPSGHTEPALGVSLYLDGLVEAGYGAATSRRLHCPQSTTPAAAAALRAEGWATIIALSPDETPNCPYVLINGHPQPSPPQE